MEIKLHFHVFMLPYKLSDRVSTNEGGGGGRENQLLLTKWTHRAVFQNQLLNT